MKNAVARLQRRLHDCETLSHGCKANYTTARRFRTPAKPITRLRDAFARLQRDSQHPQEEPPSRPPRGRIESTVR